MRLLERLEGLFPRAKKSTLREMVTARRVRVNGAVARSVNVPVKDLDRVEVANRDEAPVKRIELAEGLTLVHVDSEIVVALKPAGLLTATDAREKRPTVLAILREYFARQNARQRIFLVHRLDRDASGLLVFARSPLALAALKAQFFSHTVTRRYDAIVHGAPKPEAGRIEKWLKENPHTGRMEITFDREKGKLAVLDYRTVRADAQRGIAHVLCELHTGRKHQIRVLMKSIGHSVCGDPVYGKGDEPPDRLALHASVLAIEHPANGKRVEWRAEMPGVFGHLFRTEKIRTRSVSEAERAAAGEGRESRGG